MKLIVDHYVNPLTLLVSAETMRICVYGGVFSCLFLLLKWFLTLVFNKVGEDWSGFANRG